MSLHQFRKEQLLTEKCSDKTTIGYTAVMGLREDTNLKGQQYSNVSEVLQTLSRNQLF